VDEELRIDIGEPEIEDDLIYLEISVTINRTFLLQDADSAANINGKDSLLPAIKASGKRSSP
jgi:hypothetical protein